MWNIILLQSLVNKDVFDEIHRATQLFTLLCCGRVWFDWKREMNESDFGNANTALVSLNTLIYAYTARAPSYIYIYVYIYT